MILLSLQGVTKSFGTNEVLRDVSFVLQDGQRMGLVGGNGCGKSTLMKSIAGVETADGGTITMQKGLRLGFERRPVVLADCGGGAGFFNPENKKQGHGDKIGRPFHDTALSALPPRGARCGERQGLPYQKRYFVA